MEGCIRFAKEVICQQCGTKNHLGGIKDDDVKLISSMLPRDFVYIEHMQRLSMPVWQEILY